MASTLSTTFAARPSPPTDEMATVAHEMRTPLTAMKASLALLMEQHVSAEAQQELLTTCRRNTEYLLALVNDLLELSRIENTSPPSVEPVALAEVANETLKSFSALAAQQQVLVTAWVPSHLEVAAEADGVRRILVNLVGNALKFAAGGHVDVSAQRQENAVQIRVCDDGPGIPQERLSTLFDRYTSICRSAAQRGTGLGLAITKALVARFGGQISVQSEVNRGTCFTVALPAYDPSSDQPRILRFAEPNLDRYMEEIARW